MNGTVVAKLCEPVKIFIRTTNATLPHAPLKSGTSGSSRQQAAQSTTSSAHAVGHRQQLRGFDSFVSPAEEVRGTIGALANG